MSRIKKIETPFYAFVKYIGPDKDHAFVQRITDINDFYIEYAPTSKDYKIIDDCSYFEKGQISVKNQNYSLAKVRVTQFEGILLKNKDNSFIDCGSFPEPVNISRVRRDSNEPAIVKNEIVSINLFYKSPNFKCRRNQEVDEDEVKSKLREYLFTPKVIPDKFFLSLYREVVDPEQFKIQVCELFEKEKQNENNFLSESKLNFFVERWNLLAPELLNVSTIAREKNFEYLFQLWLDHKLPVDFWKTTIIDVCIRFFSEKTNGIDAKDVILQHLKKAHILEIQNFLPHYLKRTLEIDSVVVKDVFTAFIEGIAISDKEFYLKRIKESLSNELLYDEWITGTSEEQSLKQIKDVIIKNISNLNEQKQAEVIEAFTITELSEILWAIKPPLKKNHFDKLFKTLKSWFRGNNNFVCFDLESNAKTIYEIAWNHFSEWLVIKGEQNVINDLPQFQNKINDAEIIIGQNILDFDCQILSKYDIEFKIEKIWDTLRIETLLEPRKRHFALLTTHTAKDDADLTYDLFLNQLLRLLSQPNGQNIIDGYFSDHQLALLNSFKKELDLPWIHSDFLKEQQKVFFRKEADTSTLIEKAINSLNDSPADLKLILGPENFKIKTIGFKEIYFKNHSGSLDFHTLKKDAAINSDLPDQWVQTFLKRFLEDCQRDEILPYWANVPSLMQNKINSSCDPVTLFNIDDTIQKEILFLTINELIEEIDYLRGLKSIDVAVVMPDLITLSNKILIRKDVTFEDIRSKIKDDFWLTFPRNKGFVRLSPQHCKKLGILHPLLSNYWIEKLSIDKYQIWGNNNWEELLKSLPINNSITIRQEVVTWDFLKTYFISPENRNRKIIQLNPNSLYRAEYWAIQKGIITSIVKSSNKTLTVLLLNDGSEIDKLENYFRTIGYYVPRREASIARRIELVQESTQKQKILIEKLMDIERIVSSNNGASFNYIWNSLSFDDNYFITLDSSLQDRLKDDLRNNNSINKDVPPSVGKEENNIRSPLLLLYLNKPILDYIRDLINADGERSGVKHQIYILDSRVDDYPGLDKLWKSKTISVSLSDDVEQFQADITIAKNCIGGVQSERQIPFNVVDIKKTIASLFLGKGKNWYPEQEDYLDLILTEEMDQLITLPTGKGKSVLFQGPALYRSSFTNRLTIVVTPLKALMEDQVAALHEKGFYGSVDYLNSDRQFNNNLVLRAIAGGEISLLFITPERFRSKSFMTALNFRIQSDGKLEYAVFDEAHCISQWGHEFRPDYFNCAKMVHSLRQQTQGFPLLLFSATISSRIYNDLNHVFS